MNRPYLPTISCLEFSRCHECLYVPQNLDARKEVGWCFHFHPPQYLTLSHKHMTCILLKSRFLFFCFFKKTTSETFPSFPASVIFFSQLELPFFIVQVLLIYPQMQPHFLPVGQQMGFFQGLITGSNSCINSFNPNQVSWIKYLPKHTKIIADLNRN